MIDRSFRSEVTYRSHLCLYSTILFFFFLCVFVFFFALSRESTSNDSGL